MVGITIQAEIVVAFGLSQVRLAMFQPAGAMVGGGNVIVGVGVVGIGVSGLLKFPQSVGILALLEEPNAFRIASLSREFPAAGQPDEDCGNQ